MKRRVPTPRDPVIDRLERKLLATPDVALDVVAQLPGQSARQVFGIAAGLLRGVAPDRSKSAPVGHYIEALKTFVDQIRLRSDDGRARVRLNAAIPAFDHVHRLHQRCVEEPERAPRAADTGKLESIRWLRRLSYHLWRLNQPLVALSAHASRRDGARGGH